jgi:hypothetical protein
VSDALLTITPGSYWASTMLCPVDNDAVDGTHRVAVTATIESSADPHYQDLPASAAETTVVDDEVAFVAENLDGLSYVYPHSNGRFTIRLGVAPTHDVVVPLASSDPALGITDVPSLTFTPENWSQPQSFSVVGVDNGSQDWGVPFTVTAGPAVSEDPQLAGQSWSVDFSAYY